MPIFKFEIPDANGKPDTVSIEAADFDAAVRAIKDMRATPESGDQLHTMAQVLHFYHNTKKFKPGGFARTAQFVSRLTGWIGQWGAASFDQNKVDEFRDMRSISDQSFAREMKIVLAALRFAVKRKRLPPADYSKFEYNAPEIRRERVLSRVEVARILRASRIEVRGGASHGRRHNTRSTRRKKLFWWEIFIWIALWTGARPGAIAALEWGQIDWELCTIDFHEEHETTKRRTIVPIARALMPMLRKAYRFRDLASPYVLGNPTQPSQSGVRKLSGILPRLAERAGVELGSGRQRVTNYTLRHTTASLLLREGVSPWAVAGLLGLSVARLLKTYAKHIPSHLRDSINAL